MPHISCTIFTYFFYFVKFNFLYILFIYIVLENEAKVAKNIVVEILYIIFFTKIGLFFP